MFARTERLLLRPGFIEDAPTVATALADESIARQTRLPWPYRPDDAVAFLSQPQEPLLPRLLMLQRTGGQPRIVGGIGIQRVEEADDRSSLQLGYWVARKFWGLGYATEAARAVVAFARAHKLPRLTARHFIDNPASGAVLRKIGFRPVGTAQLDYSPARGVSAPGALYELGDEEGCKMRGRRERVTTDEDVRAEWRMLAA